jgi:DNA polymerase III subunit alpha
MPAVAMTDHGVMYGAIDFYKKARAGIKPIIGCETYVATGSRQRPREDEHRPRPPPGAAGHATKATTTWSSWCPSAHLEGFYYKPRIDKELLAAHSKGLIGTLRLPEGRGGEPPVAATWPGLQRRRQYAEIFGKDNFFLEIQDHGIPEQRKVNRPCSNWPASTGLPLVATNDVHYLKQGARRGARGDALPADADRDERPQAHALPTEEFYLKTGEEMARLFPRFPRRWPTPSRSPSAATWSSSSASCISRPSRCPTGYGRRRTT